MNPNTPRASKVVVIGSITCDLTTFSTRLPKPGETILGNDFSMVLGGKGANQAIAAARASSEVHMIGCVGDDPFRDLVLGSLNAENIDTTSVLSVAGPTGIAHIRVDDSAENDIVMVPLANAKLGVQQVTDALAALGAPGDVALIQLEIPHASAIAAAHLAHASGMTVVLDPAPAPATALDEALWSSVDIVTPNETEARLITGIDVTDAATAAEAGRWFTDRGVGRAIITLAGAGTVVVSSGGAEHYPAFKVMAVDTTAAGDAFAGALGSGLASGSDWEDALNTAMASGALAVTVAGASPSIPTRAAVEEFLAVHK